MSGDVQPRKRKDKRRKKEDEDSGTPPPTLINPSEHASDNVTIHVYKEGSTGGHWCAKIIFFALFTVLIGLVGVIIIEHRGTTDVDTPVSSPKWAVIFEGWVDDVFPFHDNYGEHEDDEKHATNESHEMEHNEEEDEHDEHDEEDDEDHDKEDAEEESEGDDDENSEEKNKDETEEDKIGTETEEDDDDQDEGMNEEEEEEDDDAQDDNDNENEENSVDDDDQEETNDDDNQESQAASDEGFASDDGDDDDDMGVLDEVDEVEDGEDNDDVTEASDGNDNDEDDITNISAPDLDMSIEGIKVPSKIGEDDVYDYMSGIPGINDIDDDDNIEPLEEVEEDEGMPTEEDTANEVDIEPFKDEVDDANEEETTSVAVKFGVGVALVIAAHFVLVRRWKNVNDSQSNETADLSRRNTIIPPANPKLNPIKGDEIDKQQQFKNYEEFNVQYKNLPADKVSSSNKNSAITENTKNIIKTAKDISSMNKKTEPQEIYTSESERFSGTEQESDYDEEDYEDEEDIEDEEAVEEEEEIDQEDNADALRNEDEVEEVDDNELVAKLEAKYGKLSTPSASEEEIDENEVEDEDEEEMDEEEDENDEDEDDRLNVRDWKRINNPQSQHSGRETQKSKDNTKESTARSSNTRDGRQEYDFFDLIADYNNDNVDIHEEFDNWLAQDLDN